MKNYIWDFDGMLFDSYPHITSAFIKAMREFGTEPDYDEAKALLEITFAHCYEHYGVTDEQKEAFRNQGIATKLMIVCEEWAKTEGCMEFAGKCQINDEDGRAFHLKLGFKGASRIICFAKSL